MNRYTTEKQGSKTIVYINGCSQAAQFDDAKKAFLYVEQQLEVERRVMRQREPKSLLQRLRSMVH